jgi:hypothetical protein
MPVCVYLWGLAQNRKQKKVCTCTYQVHTSTNIVLTEDVLSTAMPLAMPRVQVYTKYMLVQLSVHSVHTSLY